MLWKVPRKVAGVLNFKMLLLTRMGEALFRYIRLRGMEKFDSVDALVTQMHADVAQTLTIIEDFG